MKCNVGKKDHCYYGRRSSLVGRGRFTRYVFVINKLTRLLQYFRSNTITCEACVLYMDSVNKSSLDAVMRNGARSRGTNFYVCACVQGQGGEPLKSDIDKPKQSIAPSTSEAFTSKVHQKEVTCTFPDPSGIHFISTYFGYLSILCCHLYH